MGGREKSPFYYGHLLPTQQMTLKRISTARFNKDDTALISHNLAHRTLETPRRRRV